MFCLYFNLSACRRNDHAVSFSVFEGAETVPAERLLFLRHGAADNLRIIVYHLREPDRVPVNGLKTVQVSVTGLLDQIACLRHRDRMHDQ